WTTTPASRSCSAITVTSSYAARATSPRVPLGRDWNALSSTVAGFGANWCGRIITTAGGAWVTTWLASAMAWLTGLLRSIGLLESAQPQHDSRVVGRPQTTGRVPVGELV